jgi:hypothetical protein
MKLADFGPVAANANEKFLARKQPFCWQGCHFAKDNLMRPGAPLLESCVISFGWRLEYEAQLVDSNGSCSRLYSVRAGRMPKGTDSLDRAEDDAGRG